MQTGSKNCSQARDKYQIVLAGFSVADRNKGFSYTKLVTAKFPSEKNLTPRQRSASCGRVLSEFLADNQVGLSRYVISNARVTLNTHTEIFTF